MQGEIDNKGTIRWYDREGNTHRVGGPAIELLNGDKYWYRNDELHREDGPAIEFSSGQKYWYLNDVEYTEEEYSEELKKLKKNSRKKRCKK